MLLFFSFLVQQPTRRLYPIINMCNPGYDGRYPESEHINISYFQDMRNRYNLLRHLLDPSISSISKLALIEQHSERSPYKINICAGGLLDDWYSTL